MQVFGLPGHIIRSGKLASRIAAQIRPAPAQRQRAHDARRTRADRYALGQCARPERAIKQFTAYDPVARFTATKAFTTKSAG